MIKKCVRRWDVMEAVQAVQDAVRTGQLGICLRMDFERNTHVMLRSAENGDYVEIGMVPARSNV